MITLIQFLFRLSFGLALAMACTSSRQVTAGYFRVHSQVLLGLGALGFAAAWSRSEPSVWWPSAVAGALSYVSAIAWLYESRRVGKAALALVAAVSLWGSWSVDPADTRPSGTNVAAVPELAGPEPAIAKAGTGDQATLKRVLHVLDAPAGGLLLGATMAAMLLGHWYLNTPTMALEPLKRLVLLMGAAAMARAVVCGVGLVAVASGDLRVDSFWWIFLALRWLAGIVGVMAMAVMTWWTLKIPNTQSATGILYVGVIMAFIGELASQLLSGKFAFPV